MWVLLGIAVVVIGFALKLNPMLVVTVAGVVTGLLGGLSPLDILNDFGTGFAAAAPSRSSCWSCRSSAWWSATVCRSRPATSSPAWRA